MADILFPHEGQGAEIREMLEQVLSIPKNAVSFEVRFAHREPVLVRCEYHPAALAEPELDPDADPTPPDYRGLNG